jgi:FkbM family methyltransferase
VAAPWTAIRHHLPIAPDAPKVIDWLALYRDFLWIAQNRRDRLRFARAIVALAWLHREGDRAQEVTFGAMGQRFRCTLSDASQLEVLRNVFVEEEYRLPSGDEPVRTVVDLGSHVGVSVLWFRALYPNAEIVAVEPHPETFRRLQRNVGNLQRVHLVHAAVGDSDGPRALFASDESWAASLLPQPALERAGQVICRRLDGVLAELGLESVDVLKVDVEGAEHEVLSTFAGLSGVRTLVCEYHRELNRMDAFAFMRTLEGFELLSLRGDSDRHLTITARRT